MQKALRLGIQAGLFMACIGALNAAWGGGQFVTGMFPRVLLVMGVAIGSFLFAAPLYFGLGYVDASRDQPDTGLWTRPWRTRHTIIAYLAAGWLAAILIVGLGDYMLQHRLPTLSEVRFYLLFALFLGPVIALFPAWFLYHNRRVVQLFKGDD